MKHILSTIKKVKTCAAKVYAELGGGWPEKIYQSAMEVEFRKKKIEYENQRILPIDYSGFIVGESIPDLIVWVAVDDRRIGIVIDLKQDNAIKEDHCIQVQKYISALKRQLRPGEAVYKDGLVICFPKCSTKKIGEEFEEVVGEVRMFNVEGSG